MDQGNWEDDYGRAYSYGHNTARLTSRRLAHFASAYADLSEEVAELVPDLELTLEAFRLQWESGKYEGTDGEHWYVVKDTATALGEGR